MHPRLCRAFEIALAVFYSICNAAIGAWAGATWNSIRWGWVVLTIVCVASIIFTFSLFWIDSKIGIKDGGHNRMVGSWIVAFASYLGIAVITAYSVVAHISQTARLETEREAVTNYFYGIISPLTNDLTRARQDADYWSNEFEKQKTTFDVRIGSLQNDITKKDKKIDEQGYDLQLYLEPYWRPNALGNYAIDEFTNGHDYLASAQLVKLSFNESKRLGRSDLLVGGLQALYSLDCYMTNRTTNAAMQCKEELNKIVEGNRSHFETADDVYTYFNMLYPYVPSEIQPVVWTNMDKLWRRYPHGL
jgi:hypothetical protein